MIGDEILKGSMGIGRLNYHSPGETYLEFMASKRGKGGFDKGQIYALTGFGDAAIEEGDYNTATLAYLAAGTRFSVHVERKYRQFEAKQAAEKEKMRERFLAGDTSPYTSWNGDVYYHTSYGWFTDEQIENLQQCAYFNQ